MKLKSETKNQLKNRRLEELEKRHFDLYLTKISFEAVGDTTNAELINKRMQDVKQAYAAIQAIDVNKEL